MSRDVDIADFENLLILKNQLITLTTEKLIETYQDISSYVVFLDTVICMLNNESAFLYLDDSFVKKIQTVLQIHRFDIKNKEVYEAINDITKFLNDVDSANDNYRQTLVNSYKEYHQNVRNVNFATNQDFLYSLSFDAIVYLGLKGTISIPSGNDPLILSSISYILEDYPKAFESDELKSESLSQLNGVLGRSKFFELDTIILASRYKKKINNISLKGE
jgi:hypothetical protein